MRSTLRAALTFVPLVVVALPLACERASTTTTPTAPSPVGAGVLPASTNTSAPSPSAPSPSAPAPVEGGDRPRVERAVRAGDDVVLRDGPKVCALTMQESERDLAALFGAPVREHTPDADTRELVYFESEAASIRAVFVRGALFDVTAVKTGDPRLTGLTERAGGESVRAHGWITGTTTLKDVEAALGEGEGVLFRRSTGKLSPEQLARARAARPDIAGDRLEQLLTSCLVKRLHRLSPTEFTVLTYSGETLFM